MLLHIKDGKLVHLEEIQTTRSTRGHFARKQLAWSKWPIQRLVLRHHYIVHLELKNGKRFPGKEAIDRIAKKPLKSVKKLGRVLMR